MCDHIWVRMDTCVASWAQESSKILFIFLSNFSFYLCGVRFWILSCSSGAIVKSWYLHLSTLVVPKSLQPSAANRGYVLKGMRKRAALTN